MTVPGLLCAAWLAATCGMAADGQDLPTVDAKALAAKVTALKADLRKEADGILQAEGAAEAIKRLRDEAAQDKEAGFDRLQRAFLVAALASDRAAAVRVLLDEPAATEEQLVTALARHAATIELGNEEMRTLSSRGLGRQADRADSLEAKLTRFATIIGVVSILAPDSMDVANAYSSLGITYYESDDFARAVSWSKRSLALKERLAPESLTVAASLNNIGLFLSDSGDPRQAAEYLERSIAIKRRLAPDTLDLASSLGNAGLAYAALNDFDRALDYHQQALAIRQRLAPDSLDVAGALNNIANVYRARGDLAKAAEYYAQSLAIKERLAPDSLVLAAAYNNMGAISLDQGQIDQALVCHQKALALREKLAPGSLHHAYSLNNLGLVYSSKGELGKAADYYRQSIAVKERLVPDSIDLANTVVNLGAVCRRQGKLDEGLECYRRSLTILERISPDSLDVASVLTNLAVVYDDRGDLQQGDDCRARALAIQERLAPNSPDVAVTLNNMAGSRFYRAEFAKAVELYEKSLKVRERLMPESPETADCYDNLGSCYQAMDDVDRGLQFHLRSLALREKLAPGSLDVACSLDNIGSAYHTKHDNDRAEEYHGRALEIYRRLAPDSPDCADCLAELGLVAWSKGQEQTAVERCEEAVRILEGGGRLKATGREARGRFLAQHNYIYHYLIETLLSAKRVERAADVAEQQRARGFLDSLAERSLEGLSTQPDLAARRAALDTRRDDLYAELRGVAGKPAEPKRAEEIVAEMARLRLDQDSLAREIRAADPRYAAVEYPQPLTVGELARELEPGTLVLSYVVAPGLSRLFAFGPGAEVREWDIAIEEKALASRIAAYLADIAARRDTDKQAEDLGKLLLAPAREALARATRVLILPDGPLWGLPFQALVVEGAGVLGDRLPIHYAPSATVFVESRRFRQQVKPGERLLAMADPDFSILSEGDERGQYMPIRAAAFSAIRKAKNQRGLELRRLPYTGIEAECIGQTFSDKADLLLGLRASEANFRRDAPGRSVLHLATHGLIDPASPLDSAVCLSIPREPKPDDDGFLKAGEIFGLNLQGCDLVTLSACETAKGEALSGEGVIGLTRAFLYAGAASVLCTQWKVADESTAALMLRFYAHYQGGDRKDVALQEAMREIRTGKLADGSPLQLPEDIGPWKPQWKHPYFWAPFVLVGEYRNGG
jgi:CHAT domain-containing protein/Tfp pilus assembly protein PilF